MNYANDKYFNINPVNVEPTVLPESNNTIVITDPTN